MFVARVSRAGFDVNTANADEFLFREDTISLRPKQSGSFAFGGSGSQQIPIGGHTDPPVVVLKSSDNTTPGRFNYYAEVSPDLNTFRVVNSGGARTIFYYIFGGSIAQP